MRKLATYFFLLCVLGCAENKPDIKFVPLHFRGVETPAPKGSEFPYLFEKDGKLYMSWLEEREDSSFLKLAFRDGENWSEVMTAAKGTDWFVNWADFPEIHVGADGSMYMHHLEKTGNGTYAYGVEVSQKGPKEMHFTDLGQPYTDTSQTEHGFVSFFSIKEEGMAMVWLDGRKYTSGKEEMSLRSAKVDPSGNFYEETQLDGRTCDCCQTDAAATSTGAIVVYRDRSEGEIRDIYRSIYKKGAWLEPAPVASDNWEINGCPVNGPAVAAKGNEVAVTWFTVANDTPKVKIAFSHDGGEHFDSAIRIDAGNPIGRVDIVWTNERYVYVSWMERSDDKKAKIMMRSIYPGGPLSAPQVVGGISGERASGFPIMINQSDKIYLAWTQDSEVPEVVLWESFQEK